MLFVVQYVRQHGVLQFINNYQVRGRVAVENAYLPVLAEFYQTWHIGV